MASWTHAEAFRESIVYAMADHPYRKHVHVYTTREYADMRLWLTPDTQGGCAVTPEGDLVSAFRRPGGGSISNILREASEEARTLDCFDTDWFLPDLYSDYGFVPTSTVAFDPQLAPEGWDVETDGTPKVVLMLHQREVVNPLPLPTKHHPQSIHCLTWDDAEYVRDYVAGKNRGEYLRI